MRRLFTSVILLFVTAGVCGCATATVATVGAAAGIAVSAVSAGADVYRLGKLDTAEMARYHDALAAVHAAAADLSLRRHCPTTCDTCQCAKPDVARFTYLDEHEAEIAVVVERRTETLVHLRVDVGWFGSQPTARLMMERIRANLARSATTRPTTQPATLPHLSL